MTIPDAKSFETLPAGSYKLVFTAWEVRQFPSYEDKSIMEDKIMWKFEEDKSGKWVSTITSTSRGGRSKMRPILIALNGGRLPEDALMREGARLAAWLDSQIGMEVLGNVTVTPDGKFNRIETIMAVPGGGKKREITKEETTETYTDDHGNIKFA